MEKIKRQNSFDPDDMVEVPDVYDMEDEIFLKHLEARHRDEYKIESFIARHAIPAWVNTYRVFHERLHAIAFAGQHDHTHEEDEEL